MSMSANHSVNDHLAACPDVLASHNDRDLAASGVQTLHGEPSGLLEEEIDRVDELHSLTINQQNERVYTPRLPVEILSKIFFYAMHSGAVWDSSDWLLGLGSPGKNAWPPSFRDDRWIRKLHSLMQVCRFWREIALETASLWTHILPLRTCGVQLGRAKSLPLSLWIEEEYSWIAVRDLIRPHMLSLRTLRITLRPYEALDFEGVVDEAITGASNLEHLILSFPPSVDLEEHEPGHDYSTSRRYRSPSLKRDGKSIAEAAPSLKFLFIAHVARVDLQSLQLPRLQYLYLMDLEQRPSIVTLALCLNELPHLLGLRLVEVLPDKGEAKPPLLFSTPETSSLRVRLPRLEDLCLIEWASPDTDPGFVRCAAFVQLLDVPNTVHYTCECMLPETRSLPGPESWTPLMIVKLLLPFSIACRQSGFRFHYRKPNLVAQFSSVYFARPDNFGSSSVFEPFPSVNLATRNYRYEKLAGRHPVLISAWGNDLLEEILVEDWIFEPAFWSAIFASHPNLRSVGVGERAIHSLLASVAHLEAHNVIPPFEELVLQDCSLSEAFSQKARADEVGDRTLLSVLCYYLNSRHSRGQTLSRLVLRFCTGLTKDSIVTLRGAVSTLSCDYAI